MRTNQLKAAAEEYLSEYDEAMIYELLKMAKDELDGMTVEEIDEDLWLGIFQSWNPQQPDEWAFDKVQSDLDDIADQKYEEEKDRQMGID